jgi:hypothetical protein
MDVSLAATKYRVIRDRILAEDPEIDERTLADTVEGLTDVHEILQAIIRAALEDEALAGGLKSRIGEMEDRLARLQERASVRPGMPALLVLDEAEIPSIYWEPRDPKLNRSALSADLKQGAEVAGATLSNPEPILTVRTR